MGLHFVRGLIACTTQHSTAHKYFRLLEHRQRLDTRRDKKQTSWVVSLSIYNYNPKGEKRKRKRKRKKKRRRNRRWKKRRRKRVEMEKNGVKSRGRGVLGG